MSESISRNVAIGDGTNGDLFRVFLADSPPKSLDSDSGAKASGKRLAKDWACRRVLENVGPARAVPNTINLAAGNAPQQQLEAYRAAVVCRFP